MTNLRNDYFEWMYREMRGSRFPESVTHRKLFTRLHKTIFTYLFEKDENRADDGINLRRRFALIFYGEEHSDRITRELSGPCSVLEMIMALAVRCEETIMDDPSYGNRTTQWFWRMLGNLGLGTMSDDRYEEDIVDYAIRRFLTRDYEPDGKGNIFYIRNYQYDMRREDIWHQLLWYLDDLEGY